MRFVDFIIFVILIILLAGAGYAFFYFTPLFHGTNSGSFISSKEATPEMLQGLSIESRQFYENLRYSDKMIKYLISDACNDEKRKSAEEAFSIISEKTILDFYEDKNNPEIAILCSDVAPTAEEKDHFVAGEGGPSKIIETGEFFVILFGKVSLYQTDSCDEPKVAEHEILHALGFDHNSNKDSILYPITDCKQEIEQSIIDDIDKLYSIPSLPDLAINEAHANRTGKYIDFKINITNKGLKDSEGSTLHVYSGGGEIDSYQLGKMEIGKRQTLTVTNLFSVNAGNSLRFAVETNENEITKDNNEADLALE